MAEKHQNSSSSNETQEDCNYRSLRSSDLYFELPDSVYQAQELAKGNILERGMEMVGNSLKAHRACNEAIIFVYGLSGAGKQPLSIICSDLNSSISNRTKPPTPN